jgi:hypothetical protein
MSWTERDGRPVSVPERRGFGTIVMKPMAERSLKWRGPIGVCPIWPDLSLDLPGGNALRQDGDDEQILRLSGT